MSHSDETLCSTCSRSIITRGRSLDEEIIDCHLFGMGQRRITFRVTSCSGYVDARLPSMVQLIENAWVLRKGTRHRPAGFVHGRDLRADEMAALITEDSGDDGSRPDAHQRADLARQPPLHTRRVVTGPSGEAVERR